MATRVPSTTIPEVFPPHRFLSAKEREKVAARIWMDAPKEHYVNTSLVPKNGYLEFLGELGARFIYLKRDFRRNALSWLRHSGVPGRSDRGTWYHPDPSSPENQIDISGIHETLSDYQLCFWLCMEIEARAKKLSETYDVFTAEIEELSIDPKAAKKMLHWTKIPYDLNWWELFQGRKIHADIRPKEKFDDLRSKEDDLMRRLGR